MSQNALAAFNSSGNGSGVGRYGTGLEDPVLGQEFARLFNLGVPIPTSTSTPVRNLPVAPRIPIRVTGKVVGHGSAALVNPGCCLETGPGSGGFAVRWPTAWRIQRS